MPFTFKLSKRLARMKVSLVPAAAAALAACELPSTRVTEPTLPSTSVVQIVTIPDAVTLDPQQSRQLVAYGRTQAGDSVAVSATWATSNAAVATVSSSGLVTALAVGSATITATSEGQSGTATVTVTTAPSGPAYYVSPTGDDAVSCEQAQNSGTPKRTLNNAVRCLTPGTTLLIRGGTYAEALLGNIPSGTSWAEPVTLRAYPGETVVLRPSSTSWVLHFANRQSYIVIDGLVLDAAQVGIDAVKITWSGSDPSSAAHHIRLANSEVKNAPRQGILVTGSGANDNEFLGLNVHDNGSSDFDHGIYIESDRNLIEGCAFYRNAGWGIHLYDSKGTVNDNIVRRNRVYNNARVGARGPGIGVYAGSGNAVYNNLVWGNKIGIDANYGADGLRVFHNTVYGNAGEGIYNGSGSSNAVIQNNISYGNGGTAVRNAGSGATLSHNLTVDPLFVNPLAGDFRLQLGSPAIDTGITLTLVTTDFDRVARPQGIAHDIGAFEYR